MSTPRAYTGMSDSRRPIHTQGALRNSKFLSASELVSSPFKFSEVREALLDVFLIGSALLFVAAGPIASAIAAAVYIINRT